MTGGTRRRVIAFLGLLLLIGGGLAAALGAGAFGTARSDRDVFDSTVVRWWNEGGWESFAMVTAIGVVLFAIGMWMIVGQLRVNPGRHHTPDVTLPDTAKGETTVRSSALNNRLSDDLESIPDVTGASSRLFGTYPELEARAVLTVADGIDLDGLPARVDEVLDRFRTTCGTRPDPVEVTVKFKAANTDRQLT